MEHQGARFTYRTRAMMMLVELYTECSNLFFHRFLCVKSTTGNYRVHCDRLIFIYLMN